MGMKTITKKIFVVCGKNHSVEIFIYKEHYVDDSLLQSRLKICGECPNFIKMTSQCKKCGCIMKLKGLLKESVCPIGKW